MLRTRAGKYTAALLVALACAVLYIVPGRIAAGQAQVIALSAWEQRLPWLPQTVWPYLAQYPLLVFTYLRCADLARCTRFLYAVLLAQAVAAVIFVAWPLRYPREAFAAAWPPDALSAAVAGWVRAIDAPVNCLPSLHITSCLFCMLLVGRGHAPWQIACHAVAVASMASTLTFKQHYAIDLPAGAALALAAWAFAGWGLRRGVPAETTGGPPAPAGTRQPGR
jgi:hypothetical protein